MAAENIDNISTNLFSTHKTRDSVGLSKFSYPEQVKIVFGILESSIKIQAQALKDINETMKVKPKNSVEGR